MIALDILRLWLIDWCSTPTLEQYFSYIVALRLWSSKNLYMSYIQYTYIVGKYKIYLYELQKRAEQRAFGKLFRPVSQRVQMNFIFNDNVRILCLSCNVKKIGKLVRFKQKGQKQASFLAFHKCCQGCLLRGPRYISTSFILVFALRCTQLQGTRKVYSQAENLFVG